MLKAIIKHIPWSFVFNEYVFNDDDDDDDDDLTELINLPADNSHSTEGQQFSCYHNRISSDFAVLQIQTPPENVY